MPHAQEQGEPAGQPRLVRWTRARASPAGRRSQPLPTRAHQELAQEAGAVEAGAVTDAGLGQDAVDVCGDGGLGVATARPARPRSRRGRPPAWASGPGRGPLLPPRTRKRGSADPGSRASAGPAPATSRPTSA